MKDKKAHDHKGTKKLKVALFSITMMLPLIAVIPNMIYYAFNEKANNETTKVNYVAKTNDVNTKNDLIDGNIYHFSYDNPQSFGAVVFFTYGIYNHKTTSTVPTHMFLTTFDFTDVKNNYYLRYYSNATDIYISVFDSNPFSLVGTIYSIHNNYEFITNISFDFIYRPMPEGGSEILPINNITKCENIPITSVEQETNIISKSINKAINNVWEWDIFNWTTNNDIHTTINNMTSGLGITSNTYIANILTYWFIITCIYIIFDVIIELFTYLTHLLFKGKDLND